MGGGIPQVRSDDERTIRFIKALNHKQTKDCVECERSFLAALDGSCKTPIAGMVGSPSKFHTPLHTLVYAHTLHTTLHYTHTFTIFCVVLSVRDAYARVHTHTHTHHIYIYIYIYSYIHAHASTRSRPRVARR